MTTVALPVTPCWLHHSSLNGKPPIIGDQTPGFAKDLMGGPSTIGVSNPALSPFSPYGGLAWPLSFGIAPKIDQEFGILAVNFPVQLQVIYNTGAGDVNDFDRPFRVVLLKNGIEVWSQEIAPTQPGGGRNPGPGWDYRSMGVVGGSTIYLIDDTMTIADRFSNPIPWTQGDQFALSVKGAVIPLATSNTGSIDWYFFLNCVQVPGGTVASNFTTQLVQPATGTIEVDLGERRKVPEPVWPPRPHYPPQPQGPIPVQVVK